MPVAWYAGTALALAAVAVSVGVFVGVVVLGPGSMDARARSLGFDFRVNVWNGAAAALGERPLYPAHVGDRVSHAVSANPPFLPVLSVPLRVLPYGVALALWDVVSALGFLLALRLAGVRDWRVYALACGAPFVSGLVFGQLSALLGLGYVLAWRFRDRRFSAGAVVAVMIALKLLALPLVVWLALTRRTWAALVAVGGALALVLTSWAVIGFQGLGSYPRLLARSATSWGPSTYSPFAALVAGGLSTSAARAFELLLGLTLLLCCAQHARKRRDAASFAAAALAGLFATPVIHLHYLVWIAILLALVSPRLGLPWLAIVALWITPTEPPRSHWQLAVTLSLMLGLTAFLVRPGPSRGSPGP